MKKISTYFKKDPNDLSKVTRDVAPENSWVEEFWFPTRKYDWTSCAIINGELYKRFDAKIDRSTWKYKDIPEWAIPCQEPDEKSWHYPHWIKCYREDNWSKYHFEAFDKLNDIVDWTYELCWPKINWNPERLNEHILIEHWRDAVCYINSFSDWPISDFSYDWLKEFLWRKEVDIEWIVFHHIYDSTKMCKIRKCDFWFKR